MVEIPKKAIDAAAKAIADSIGHGMSEKCFDHARAGLTAAAPHMSGVKVKQLEWNIGDDLYSAGRYNIGDLGDNWSDDRYQLYEAGTRIATFPSLEKAKAAAQADYEKRILSAIEPSSAREQALDLSVLERMAEKAGEFDAPDVLGPYPNIQDAMVTVGDLRKLRKLLAAIRALKSQPAPQTGGGE